MCASLLFGCSQHAGKTAERSVSPLIGTWTRDGNVPRGGGGDGPPFTKLSKLYLTASGASDAAVFSKS